MAINFPSSPTIGQVYEYQSIRWRWNGSAWDKYEVFTFNGLTANVEGVARFNGLTGSVGISAGQLIDITLTGSTFTISSPDTLYGISGNIYASNLATGLLYGGILSINAGNTAQFDITGGKGQIHASGSGFTSGPFPLFNYVTWPGQTGITLTYLATHDTTWIYIDETGVLHQRTEYYTDEQLEENIIIGQLLHPSRAYINLARTNPNVAYATDKQYEQFIRAFGPIKVSGHTIIPNGANLKLNRSSGKAFSLGRNWINDTDNPSVVSDPAQTDCIFYRYYRGATAGTFITVPNQTVIDPGNYDNGSGTLQTAPGGKYSIQRLFYYPNTPTLLGVYYGRALYNSLADAAANINLEQFTEIENTRTNAIFAGYLIVRAGTTNLSNSSDALILQSGSFRSTTSGGGSVSLTLDDLTDVIITSPQDFQVLAYVDGVTGWENKSVSTLPLVYSFNGATGAVSGVNSVNGLTGVLIVSGGTGMSVLSGGKGITLVNTGVLSFNGLTGAVTGVTTSVANIFGPVQTFNSGISAAGATLSRTTTIPAGSTLSVLGNITGNVVSSVNGFTGAVTNIARTDVDNNFTSSQTVTNGMNLTTYGLNEIYFYDDISGSETFLYPSTAAGTQTVTLPGGFNTTLAGLATTQTFTGVNTFSSVANFSAGVSAAGATFTSLLRATAGISASGGVTFSNKVNAIQGVVGGYTRLEWCGLTSGFDIIPTGWANMSAPIGTSPTANDAYFAPIFIANRIRITAIGHQNASGGGGNTGSFMVGLYDSDDYGYPRNRLYGSAATTLSTGSFTTQRVTGSKHYRKSRSVLVSNHI
jgi:hypothetical protein